MYLYLLGRTPLESPARNISYRNVSGAVGEQGKRTTRKTGLFRPAGHVSNSNKRSAVHERRSRDQIWRHCEGQPLGGQLFPRVAAARSIDEQQDNPIWFIFMSTPAFNSCRSRGRTRHCAYWVIPREEAAPTGASFPEHTRRQRTALAKSSHETSQLISSSFRARRDGEGALRRERLNWSAIQPMVRLVHTSSSSLLRLLEHFKKR